MSPAFVLGDKLWKAEGGCTAGSVSPCRESQTSLPLFLGRKTCPGNTPSPSLSLEAAANHTILVNAHQVGLRTREEERAV